MPHNLPLNPCGINLYLCDTSINQQNILDFLSDHLHLLSPPEKQRFAKIKSLTSQRNYALGRIMIRNILAGFLQLAPTDIEITISASGKPVLNQEIDYKTRIHFNLSHSHDCLVLAVCSSGEIGIDVEYTRRKIKADEILKHFFNYEEQIAYQKINAEEAQRKFFFSLWTLKEALLKMTGDGLSYGLDKFFLTLDMPNQKIDLSLFSGTNTNTLYGATYNYRDDYIVSVFAQNINNPSIKRQVVNLLTYPSLEPLLKPMLYYETLA